MNSKNLKLILITNLDTPKIPNYLAHLETAIKSGVTMIQLRDKKLPPRELRAKAIEINALCKKYNIPFIINDHVELTKEIDAAGTHLGQDDTSPQKAREILGNDKIIGLSIESLEQLNKANTLHCLDYVAASSVFLSTTKECKNIWGLGAIKTFVQSSKFPVVGIGGINAGNVRFVFEQGVSGVAMISALHDPQNLELTIKKIHDEINAGIEYAHN